MKKILSNFVIPILFVAITLIFFYPILKGYIPFPGDLLVSTSPYNSYSYLGYAPGGVPNKAQGPDVMHELFPWKYFVIDSLQHGQIPFWTPYNFSGNTIMANFQSGTFYPLNVIFFALPFLSAWTVFIALAPFLAGLFTFLFLRSLQRSVLASLFGGVVFAFSSYMVVWMEYGNITHTLMWLPLALYFTELFIRKGNLKYLFLLILSLWVSFLAGYIQGFFYLSVILVVYFLIKGDVIRKRSVKKTFLFSLALFFPVLLSLFQLLPTFALFGMSSRGSYNLSQITELLNPWWYSITVFAPDFFGNPAFRNSWFYGTYIERVSFFGVLPLLFALTALFSFTKKDDAAGSQKTIRVFSILFVISFLLSIDLFVTRYFFQLPIPMLSTTVPTRILSIFVFSGAILSAYGLDFFLQGNMRKRFLLVAGIITGSACCMWSFVLLQHDPTFLVAKKNLILPTVLAGVYLFLIFFRFSSWYKKILYAGPVIFLVVFILTCFDLFYFFHKITPFSPKTFVYPQTSVFDYLKTSMGINRYWGYGSAYIDSNYQTVNKTYTPEGFDALHLRWYTEYLSGSTNGKLSESVSRDNANLASGYGTADLRVNQFRQKALNLLGVKYVLHKDEAFANKHVADIATFDEKTYRLLWQDGAWQIYENLLAAPRFFLTKEYRVEKNPGQAIRLLYSDTFDEHHEVLLEDNPLLSEKKLTVDKTKLLSYTPNRVIIETETDADALLFLSDTYSPYWRATIDTRNVSVLKTDYAFRSVKVPEGKHKVVFYYKDGYFEYGLIASILFAGIGLTGFVLLRKKSV